MAVKDLRYRKINSVNILYVIVNNNLGTLNKVMKINI